MLAPEARELEQQFESIALEPGIHPRIRARHLSRLLRQMFDEAIRDLRDGAENAHIRASFVLDFVERADLAPFLLRECFAANAEPGDDAGLRELKQLIAMKKPELEHCLPPPANGL